jgi:hypothetical protein
MNKPRKRKMETGEKVIHTGEAERIYRVLVRGEP